ncbi:MAG: hypothetical protein KAJ86_00855 [Alphaproteobacteria bacterium]|nr:hypothetical protein [Alphaproteobacteria bacterium]
MTQQQTIKFIDNNSATNSQYICVNVDILKILESWRDSVFSFQWLHADGSIKTLNELSEYERPKRELVEQTLKKRKPIVQPILGIGIQENIEIGTGRAELLTLAAHNVKTIPVHIPKTNESDFQVFLADVNS